MVTQLIVIILYYYSFFRKKSQIFSLKIITLRDNNYELEEGYAINSKWTLVAQKSISQGDNSIFGLLVCPS